MSYQFKHLAKGGTVGSGSFVFRKYSEQVAPTVEPFLTFSSPSSFTLEVVDHIKYWDGTLEYSTNKTTWNTWDGTTTLNSGTNNELYLRGTGNTKITGYDSGATKARWVLTGSSISCNGNIENLLDYATVALGNHPAMASECYKYLFQNCDSLISAPQLLATTLTQYCYTYMFSNCDGLTTPPQLPATTLALGCYQNMFSSCSNLEVLPSLPATVMKSSCYGVMFRYCSKIKLSETQTGEYVNEYRLPSSGNGTTASSWSSNMFASTGGTFKGTPAINTKYYTSNTVI